MKQFTDRNTDVVNGLAIVMIIFIILELVAEIIMAGIWSKAVQDPVIAVYVITSTVVYCIPGVASVGIMIGHKFFSKCVSLKQNQNKNNIEMQPPQGDPEGQNDTNNNNQKKCCDFCKIFLCHLFHLLRKYPFIWVSSYFSYLLLYSFFPAFILAFAYPIRVISVFVFMLTFIVLFMVYVITYLTRKVEVLIYCEDRCCCSKDRCHSITKFAIGFLITLMFLYFFLFVFGLLYSLIIGRASVVSSAPLAVLSLLPSILISIAAWIIKKTLLDEKLDDTKDKEYQANKHIDPTTVEENPL